MDVLCLRDNKKESNEQGDEVRIFTVPISRFASNFRSYILEYGIAFILFTVKLLGLYIRNRYDVIHIHNMPDFIIFTALIPRIFGAKLVLDIHDPMPEFYMSKAKSRRNSIVVRLMEIQEKLSSFFAHAIITANSNFKDNLSKRGITAERITVVNNYPDSEVFNRNHYREGSRHDREPFTLIYPGTMAPRYGLDVAIRALPMLTERIPKLHLVFIGAYREHVSELAALANQLRVSAFTQFKPAIPMEEVPRVIAQADIGIYPALPDPHMSIAMPVKVLEYAIMGIPIIGSRLKVLTDIFGESAVMFFDPGDVDQFASCVFELFDNPARREELVRNADKIFSGTYNWKNERQIYFKLLNKLIAPRTWMNASDEMIECSTEEAP